MLEHLDVLDVCCSWLQLSQQYVDTILVQYASVQPFFLLRTFSTIYECKPSLCNFWYKEGYDISEIEPPILFSNVFVRVESL